MSDAILIFTFSPIQSFINEARRAEDLFNGSAILVELAKAAAQAISEENLIYPAPPLRGDVPNVLVARLTFEQTKDTAVKAEEALRNKWEKIAADARYQMRIPEDEVWQNIWNRQAKPEMIWQIYWAAAPIEEGGYREAYEQARRALDALKRSRLFLPSEERGQKDSLSGNREALRTGKFRKAREYWSYLAELPGIHPSRIRPHGRERLDAIGAVKRFAELRSKNFPSTSTVASADFLAKAKQSAPSELSAYKKILDELMDSEGNKLFSVSKDPIWPYDGDLFYEETLTTQRLKEDYRINKINKQHIEQCRKGLENLYKACGSRPSKYYAVIVLDGDSMGETISSLLLGSEPDSAHKAFSRKLAAFSNQVPGIVGDSLVYNGGDDVLCMAPLSEAVPLAARLAETFRKTKPNNGWFKGLQVPETSASAGIAITHHQSPLDFALESGRRAERLAKNLGGKDAVCVSVLRRGGEPLEMRSKWKDLGSQLLELQELFEDQLLSSRLAYAIYHDAPVLSGLPMEARESALKVILRRQSAEGFMESEIWATRLSQWAATLDGYLPEGSRGPCGAEAMSRPGLLEVANWLVLARFIASGGGE